MAWGLEAQRTEIEAFAPREGFSITSWYQDIQTGGGADALQLRPGLAAASWPSLLSGRQVPAFRPHY